MCVSIATAVVFLYLTAASLYVTDTEACIIHAVSDTAAYCWVQIEMAAASHFTFQALLRLPEVLEPADTRHRQGSGPKKSPRFTPQGCGTGPPDQTPSTPSFSGLGAFTQTANPISAGRGGEADKSPEPYRAAASARCSSEDKPSASLTLSALPRRRNK